MRTLSIYLKYNKIYVGQHEESSVDWWRRIRRTDDELYIYICIYIYLSNYVSIYLSISLSISLSI